MDTDSWFHFEVPHGDDVVRVHLTKGEALQVMDAIAQRIAEEALT